MRRVLVLVLLAACRPPGWGKTFDVDASTPDADTSPAPDAAPSAPDAAHITCDQTFRLEGHDTATEVDLTGDFSSWSALPMTLGGDGAWTVTHTFDQGSYQYKFVVDGVWIADPANPNTVDDGFGGFNSLYACN